jgi:deazaflavin-dependent oxidoreductase (nitroreductase family)
MLNDRQPRLGCLLAEKRSCMSSQKTLVSRPPSGALRRLARLPIALYRLRLGWRPWQRFVLLEPIGRTSGQVRQTIVEVIGHDRASDTSSIASGWGRRANWYHNLLATPTITMQVGRGHLHVCAEPVPPPEGVRVLLDYRQSHPPLYPRTQPGADGRKPDEGITRGPGAPRAGVAAHRRAPHGAK